MKKLIVIFCLLAAIASMAMLVHFLLTIQHTTDLIINGIIFVVILAIGIALTFKSKDGTECPIEVKLGLAIILSVLAIVMTILALSHPLIFDVFLVYYVSISSGLIILFVMNSFIYIVKEK